MSKSKPGRVIRPDRSRIMHVLEDVVEREEYHVTIEQLVERSGVNPVQAERIMSELETIDHMGIERDRYHPDLAWTVKW